MVPYYGDFAEDDTVIIPFNTFTSDDPSASCTITELADTDVWIYKDGNVAQHAADATVNLALNFDGITGSHLCVIDTSQDAFFATGSEYQVRIVGTVVDGATIEVFIGAFSIERAGGSIALLKLIQAAVITNAAGTDVAADIIAIKAETALIVEDTNELQTDDYPTSIAAVKAETALIVADTNELQTDDYPTTLTAIKAKTDLIPASPAAVGSAMTLADDAITAAKIASNALAIAKFAADVGSTAYASNPVAQAATKALDNAFTDATSLTANSLLDRIRTLCWIIRNKMVVTDASGNTVLYKDDNSTPAFSVNAALTDDSTDTTRLRLE